MKASRAAARPGTIGAQGGRVPGDEGHGEGGARTRLRVVKGAPCVSMPARPPAATTTSNSPPPLLTTLDGYAAYALWTAIIATGVCGPLIPWVVVVAVRTRAALAVALTVSALAAALAAWPLPEEGVPPPAWADALCRYLVTRTLRFLRPFTDDGGAGLRVVCAPGAAAALEGVVGSGRPVMLAVEPHSTLPLGPVLAFSPHAQAELAPGARPPPALVGARFAASSACFAVPLVRHLWWWLGVRPADKESVRALLGGSGHGGPRTRHHRPPPALALCPGGVAEVALLTRPPPPPAPKTETLFLTARTGYVREALRARAAVLPVFVLGQTSMFAWTRPPVLPRRLLEQAARSVGFMPLWIHNGRGAPCAKRSAQLTVLVGGPVAEVEAAAAGGGRADPDAVRAGADGVIREMVGLVRALQGGVEGEEETVVVVV